MEGMIFSAGYGTRLQPLTNSIPKALVEVNSITLLEHNILKMISYGIKHIVINVHHLSEIIIQYIEKKNYPAQILISYEEELLDTSGGLFKARDLFSVKHDILVHNVDILSFIDFLELENHHKANKSLSTLCVSKRNTSRYLLFNSLGQLSGWENIKTNERIISNPSEEYNQLAFSGIQIIKPELIQYLNPKGSIIPCLLEISKTNKISNFIHDKDIWLDVGNPKALIKAQDFYTNKQ